MVMASPVNAQTSEEGNPELVQLDRCTYELVDKRKGGMGTVWLLQRPSGAPSDTIYGSKRAAKTFDVKEDEQEAVIEQELGNWAILNHERIVPLIKICRINFELAAFMERMAGNLSDYLNQHQKLDDKAAIRLILDLLEGLNYASGQRHVVHLDLKPENLLLYSLSSPRVKISDWGLSRIMSKTPQHADWLTDTREWLKRQTVEMTGLAGGTLPYMAPERFSGSWSVGPAADVFSVGIIAVQSLTGQLPSVDYIDNRPERCIALIVSQRYLRRARDLLAKTNKSLAAFILKLLESDSARRPQDYSALISELTEIRV